MLPHNISESCADLFSSLLFSGRQADSKKLQEIRGWDGS
jgi:hypothetical protein